MRSILVSLLFLLYYSDGIARQVVVSPDGKGDFISIQAAIDAAPDQYQQPWVIQIKAGVYYEKVVVPSWKTNIQLLGEDSSNTIISWDDHAGKNQHTTFTSYTLLVRGNGFRAEHITVENTAGKDVGQAVAVHVEADRCVFKYCRFVANQDTLYAGVDNSRQYYYKCYIEGTTDFIFGPATAVFDQCRIYAKKNSYITAASTPENKQYGFIFFDCKISASDEVSGLYLGRPWRPHAKTVFIRCSMNAPIKETGWHNWSKPDAELTVFYAEYMSTGTGANPTQRASWSKQLSESDLSKYTLHEVFNGWKP